MKFYVSTAFLNTREVVEIAKAADDLGYDGIGIPDHVVNLETLETPYPVHQGRQARWEPFTDWPDPWVMIGAIALVTDAAEVRHHGLPARDARPVLGGQSDWHRGLSGRRAGGTRHRRRLVRRGVRR